MIGFSICTVEANSPNYLHVDWWTGSFGKGAIPDGDGRAGVGGRRNCEEGEILENENSTFSDCLVVPSTSLFCEVYTYGVIH